MNLVHYSSCPVCNSNAIDPLLTVKDHSISQQHFPVWQCRTCQLRFTQDVPAENEIGPYYQSEDYVSHSDTSKGLINKLYQRVRRITLQQKASLIKKYTGATGRILDVGAGTGAFLYTMQNSGWTVTGIEPDEGARRHAAALYDLQLQPKESLQSLEPGSFEAITLWHVLEHVHQLHQYVEKLKELVKPGGKIFIAVPNYTALDAQLYGSYWAAYDVPRHLYHFSPRSMEVLLQQHGLRIVAKKPMWFDSFYVSMLSSKYRKGSLIKAGINGLRSNLLAMLQKDRCSSLIYIAEKI